MGIARVTAISAGVAGALYPWGCAQHRGPETYYLQGAEGPGAAVPEARWLGDGLADLGFTQGEQINKDDFVTLFGRLADPRAYDAALVETKAAARERIAERLLQEPGASKERRTEIRHEEHDRARADAVEQSRLGRRVSQFKTFEELREERLRLEPHAEPERIKAIEREVRGQLRQPVGMFDITFSAQKSVSVYHASLLAAGRFEDAEKVLAAHRAGVQAALDLIQKEAGYTRAGYHGRSVEGRPTTGRYVDAHNLIAGEFLHYTSREGDPQLHSHLEILNRVRTVDEKTGEVTWRTLDSRALHKLRPAISMEYERGMEKKLVETTPVELATRPDGLGREIVGIKQEWLDAFSTRTGQVEAEREKMIAAYKEIHGPDAEPSKYLLERMRNESALRSRKGKDETLPLPKLVEQYERAAVERLRLDLEQIAPAAERASAQEQLRRLLAQEQLRPEQVIREALEQVQQGRSSWSRADLFSHLGRVVPDTVQGSEIVHQLTDEALSGRYGVVQVRGFRLVEPPAELRRDSDGVAQFQAHDTAYYALDAHLTKEEYLLTRAQTAGGPALHRDLVEQIIREKGTLSADQADVVRGVLTQGRQMAPVVGPAGAGKSHTMGVVAQAWKEHIGAPVTGLAIGTVAADNLAGMGVDNTSNLRLFLDMQKCITEGRANAADRMRFGLVKDQLLILDEASTANTEMFNEVAQLAQKAGAIVVPVGDPEQRGSVGAGGVFRLMTREAQPLQLENVYRMRADWEKLASLRLRAGDASVLDEYDKRGRFQGGTREEMYTAAARTFVARNLDGREAVVITDTNDEAAAVAGMVRQQLVELGRVEETGVPVSHGNIAGVGDLIQTRRNLKISDSEGVKVSNRRIYQVLSHNDDGSLTGRLVEALDEDGLQLGGEVRLDGDYVRDNADLAYSGTVDAVQGRSVYTDIELITPKTTRTRLYPGLTRGTEENIGLVITDEDRGAGHDHPHVEELDGDLAREVAAQAQERPDYMTVLEQVLRNDDAERSALEHFRADMDYQGSMPANEPEWRGYTEEIGAEQYAAQVAQLLPASQVEQLLQDPGSVWALMREAEQLGHDPRALLTEAIGQRSMDDARDVAALLYDRVQNTVARREPEREVDLSSYVARTPQLEDARAEHCMKLAEVIDARRDVLGEQAAVTPPAWALREIGPVPEEPLARMDWERRVGVIERFREERGITDDKTVIGPMPKIGGGRIDWEAAYIALGRPDDPVARANDEQLRRMVDAYEREKAWAPRHVDEQMREAYQTRQAQQEQLAFQRAGLGGITDEQARRDAEQDIARREALIGTLDQQIGDLELINQGRDAWHNATVDTREAALAARAELERREAADAATTRPDRETQPEITEAAAAEQEQNEPQEQLRQDQEHTLARDDQRETGTAEPAIETVPDRGEQAQERDQEHAPERGAAEEHTGAPVEQEQLRQGQEQERNEAQTAQTDPSPAPEAPVAEAEEQRDRGAVERETAPQERAEERLRHGQEQKRPEEQTREPASHATATERTAATPKQPTAAPKQPAPAVAASATAKALDLAREVERAREALAKVAEQTTAAQAAEDAERTEQARVVQARETGARSVAELERD